MKTYSLVLTIEGANGTIGLPAIRGIAEDDLIAVRQTLREQAEPGDTVNITEIQD